MNQALQKGNILIVDDEAIVRKIHRIMLIDLGYQVEEAENGQQAIEKYTLASGKFDFIFMDYHMPLMNGIETTQKILELSKNYGNVKIIGIMGLDDATINDSCLASGMHQVILKPISKDILKSILQPYN